MKYVTTILASIFMAAVATLASSAVDPPAAEAASGGYATKCGGGKILLNAKEKRSFVLHNRVRNDRNLKPFCVHPALQKAARAHSKDMIRRDYFSHYTEGSGEDPGDRLKRAGYNWRTYGENIGYNSTPDAMFKAWMKSDGHRKNIVNGAFREIGVGTYTGDYRGYRTTMYTVDFGARL